ncbi:HlyD family type I secretion periplasmic adaptor subunit [Roseococcus suduntuyensis]|uniref:Membrane fusion protein (MFP) family protein n=1 Tax=Roseococcus suduntuyensis TaxID=455361 RepID=A0A840AD14_9PROT|nr:HlyD family type I secretion periplasmic adaptor subunit [Roseococcus suduntuyensis]MBB3899031.1 HlyD family type I secretion membrane fusion protein [Roseococcus suduntuyensis]
MSMQPASPTAMLEAPHPPTRGVILCGMFVMLGCFGGFMAWATLAPLAEATVASGVITVEGTRRTVQHLEGGVVRAILVRDGDRVRAGQVVLRLDDVQAGTARETLRAQQASLLAHAARLSAEAAGHGALSFPAALQHMGNPRAREAMAGQVALFTARRAALDGQLAIVATREAQGRASLESAQGQLRATERQRDLIVQEEAMRRGLVNQGLSRLPELLAVQRGRAAVEGSMDELQGQVARARATIEEAERQAQSLLSQRSQEVNAEAREVATRLAEVEERLMAADDVALRRDILAPADGTVVNSRVFTLGGVVRPGESLLDIVPSADRLVAEVNISPTDIDAVRTGLPAQLRLPAFRQNMVPYLSGEVIFVAADVTTDPQTRMSHYRARIALDEAALARMPGVFLSPGMPVEAHVITGARSFWRYMTQPLRESLRRAFTEP